MYRAILFLILLKGPLLFGSVLEEVVNMQSFGIQVEQPSPLKLSPQWWNYFNVEGEELQQRILWTSDALQRVYVSLPIEEQTHFHSTVNKIITTLNAYASVKKKGAEPKEPVAFLKSYTLDEELRLHKELRKLKEEIENEKQRLDQSKIRLTSTQKYIDNLMVQYMALGSSSTDKLRLGLEIMMHTSNVKFGEENLKNDLTRYQNLNERSKKLDEALEYSKEHLDVHNLDTAGIEKHIAMLENELDKSQKELSTVESNLLGHFNDAFSDRHQQLAFEQKLLRAQVNRAYVWSQLAFHTLKYNVLMHFNERLDQHQMRVTLARWEEQVNEIKALMKQWKEVSLKEQDRIRHEYASLIAQNERADSSMMKVNLAERQGVLNILTTLDLLKEEIANTQWLIHLLDSYFKTHSGFVVNWWIGISAFFTKEWSDFLDVMNFSLFKVIGIPITLWSILKFIAICGSFFWVSLLARRALKAYSKKKEEWCESTIHILSALGQYSILFLGLVVALCSIGFDFNNLLIVMGVILFGISFGLQSIANNFFCGLRILFEKKLNIGDDIELHSGQHGRVAEIHIQNTVVCTSDGQKVIVPNSEIIGNTLFNWTREEDYRRLHIPFSVSASNDKEHVRKLVIDAALKVPCTINNGTYSEPQVWLTHFDSYILKFELVVWVDYNIDSVTESKEADFLWEIESALRKGNVERAHPLPHLLQTMQLN